MAKTKPTAVMDPPEQIEIGLPNQPAAPPASQPEPDPLPVLRSRMDPASLIHPSGRYTCKHLEALLGIPAKQIAHALKQSTVFVQTWGGDLLNSEHVQVGGESVRAWLIKDKPECRIPAGVQAADTSRQPPGTITRPTPRPTLAAPEQEPRTAGERLAKQLRDADQAEQAAVEANQAEIWKHLVPILAKGDERTPADVEQMVELANDLGMDATRLGQAQDAVADLARLRQVAGRRQELLRTSYQANAAYRKLRDKKDEELEAARKHARQAQSSADLARDAASKIDDLRRRWPMLFATE